MELSCAGKGSRRTVRALRKRGAQIIGALVVPGRSQPSTADSARARHLSRPASLRISGIRNRMAQTIGRHRIAGQAEHVHGAKPAMHDRPPRAQRDLPERQGEPFRGERLLHEIVVAHRGAAGGNQHVGAEIAGAADGGGSLVKAVRHDAEVDDLAALAARPAPWWQSRWNRRSRRSPVRCRAAPVRRRSPAPQPWACDGPAGRVVHRGGERKIARGEAGALGQQHGPGLEIEAGARACVGPWRCARVTTTVSPSRLVFSWITIVSAPGGRTPPVKMRAA